MDAALKDSVQKESELEKELSLAQGEIDRKQKSAEREADCLNKKIRSLQ